MGVCYKSILFEPFFRRLNWEMSRKEEKGLKNVFGEEDDDSSSDDINQLHINAKYKDE